VLAVFVIAVLLLLQYSLQKQAKTAVHFLRLLQVLLYAWYCNTFTVFTLIYFLHHSM